MYDYKLIFKILLTAALSLFFMSIILHAEDYYPRKIDSKDHGIMVSASVQKLPTPSITLKWTTSDVCNKYEIHRKKLNDVEWQGPIAELDSAANEYLDEDIEVGVAYEYEVSSFGRATLLLHPTDNQGNPKDSAIQYYFHGFGYALSGIEAGPYDDYGKALILVDQTIAPALEKELAALSDALTEEGWGTKIVPVKRSEEFDSAAVRDIKKLIVEEYNSSNKTISAVILIGRIAVPYSGRMNPDGHDDHIGAWSADLYYASLQENLWKDEEVNLIGNGRAENTNVPADGKFDLSYANTEFVDLELGRIDFFRLPEFSQSETELIRNYFERNLKYRRGEFQPEFRGLVSDNFPAWEHQFREGFASTGWRNFGALLGKENTFALNWPQTLSTDTYLWAYGCGAGYYTSAGHIGDTKYFATTPVNAVFTMLFGSYFGDYDCENDLLRAALASSPSVLTCSWAGRPPWYLHHMAFGFPIGYSAALSQNNDFFYLSNIYYLFGLNGGQYASIKGRRGVHAALMGDPTLRMYMNDVPPPKNLMAVKQDNESLLLTWNPPDDDPMNRYRVYIAAQQGDAFVPLTKGSIKENYYQTDTKLTGREIFLVKTVRLQTVNTGSFYNTSRGALINPAAGIHDDTAGISMAECLTNPASKSAAFSIRSGKSSHLDITIFSGDARKVKNLYSGGIAEGESRFNWDLAEGNGERVVPGVYFAQVKMADKVQFLKFIVQP